MKINLSAAFLIGFGFFVDLLILEHYFGLFCRFFDQFLFHWVMIIILYLALDLAGSFLLLDNIVTLEGKVDTLNIFSFIDIYNFFKQFFCVGSTFGRDLKIGYFKLLCFFQSLLFGYLSEL